MNNNQNQQTLKSPNSQQSNNQMHKSNVFDEMESLMNHPLSLESRIARQFIQKNKVKLYRSREYEYCFQKQQYKLIEWQKWKQQLAEKLLSQVAKLPTAVKTVEDSVKLLTPEIDKEHDSYVAFSNGLLNLTTGKLEPCTDEVFTTAVYDIPFMKSDELKSFLTKSYFLNFIQTVSDRDMKHAQLLLDILSYSLDQSAANDKIVFLSGSGGNGKSLFLQIIGDVLHAPEYVSGVSLTQLAERFNLSELENKKINISGELGGLQQISVQQAEILKTISGGDRVSIEKKYEDSKTVRLFTKLYFAVNHLPKFSDDSDGMKRRLICIPFNVTIPADKRDPKLFEKIKEERALVINYAYWNLMMNKQKQQKIGIEAYQFDLPEYCEALKKQMFAYTLKDIFNDNFEVTGNLTDRLARSIVTKKLENESLEYGVAVKKQDIRMLYDNTKGIKSFKSGVEMLSGIKPKYNLSPERHVDPETGECIGNV